MRIRTQYLILMALVGVVLLASFASVLVTNSRVEHLNEQATVATAVERGASDLSYMSNDYLLNQGAAQRRRWETTWAEVDRNLARLEPTGREDARLAGRLRRAHERLRVTFEEVAQKIDSEQPGLEDAAFIRTSWSRLAIQSQNIAFDSLTLTRLQFEEVERARRFNRMLVSTLLLAFMLLFVVNYLLINRRTLGSLSELTQSTRVIGSGNLDYTIPVRRRDEIGELSAAFNRMIADLKAVTTTKSELEREVEERARAEKSARQELETSEMLLSAAEALARWTDLPALLGGILDSVQRMTGHSRASVALVDDAEEYVQILASRGLGAPSEGTRVRIQDMSVYAREAVKQRKPLVADYDVVDGEARGAVLEDDVRLALIMPLVYQEHVVGLIRLDEPGECVPFEERDIRVISALAVQSANAIVNARVYEAEHGIAETLQAALLAMPEQVEGIDFGCFYHSASHAARVGGDFYDIFELESPLIGVTIGDVSGKGLEAAVLTSLIKSTIRAKAIERAESPAEVLSSANSVLHQSSPTEVFATVFFGVYDRESGRLRYCNAGHTTGAVLCASGQVIPLEAESPLVGAFGEAAFVDTEVVLGTSDLLFLYTDGLIEARRDKDFFGEQRLLELLGSLGGLPADEVIDRVSSEVLAFTGGTLGDDAAILALRSKR